MFDNMIKDLKITSDAFKDSHFNAITEQQFQTFLKEAVFEKLKGRHLGKLFSEKFGVFDRALIMFSEDRDIIQHIRYCKYVR